MSETFILTEKKLDEVVDAIFAQGDFSLIILLKGDLGSGKTTLARKIINKLGICDTVTSPTFNIVSEYKQIDGKSVYHFDLYRIKSIDELYEIGFDEYIDSGAVCIIEWPEIAEPLLSVNRIEINISLVEEMRGYDLNRLPI